jgi:YspA, cpYpsA-related SLOG family
MRVLVTISRDWDDYEAIHDAVNNLWVGYDSFDITIVHGASQMDWFIAGVAYTFGMDLEAHPADWDAYGKAAGMIRNGDMVALGADLFLAFIKNNSNGATDCARKAERAGIQMDVHRQ